MNAVLPALGLLLALRPLGGEFRVNTVTTADEILAEVAADPQGNFVVVWLEPDENRTGVLAQRFAASGAPVAKAFRVNTYTTELQVEPAVARAADAFVVVWKSLGQDGSTHGVFGQKFDGSGAPLGGEFRVNTYTTGGQFSPAVAVQPAGGFVVTFTGYDENSLGVFLRRFQSNGTPVASELRVNSTTTGVQSESALAVDASGAFVVVWGSQGNIVARRFGPDGTPLASEFRVNSVGGAGSPSVARNPAGRFVVSWENADFNLVARAFSADAQPLGAEFRLNADVGGAPFGLVLGDGRFVVTLPGLPTNDIVLGQFDASGDRLGSEMRVNTYTTGLQSSAHIAGHAGGFVVVWTGSAGDGDGDAIFAQRFSLLPVRGDANGDGLVTVLDILYLINFLFASGPAPVN